jgi:hypothetical protein
MEATKTNSTPADRETSTERYTEDDGPDQHHHNSINSRYSTRILLRALQTGPDNGCTRETKLRGM